MNQTFIQRLAQHITSNYDLRRQSLTIVFPNKRAAFYLRKNFADNIKQTIWLPQMLSIEEAVTQWSGFELADNIDLMFELIEIFAELHPEKANNRDDLHIFGSQATQMAKDFDEIDQYDVNATDLFNLVNADKELQIWNFDEENRKEKEQKYLQFFRSLIQYYDRLRQRLEEKHIGYYGMITRHLAHLDDEKLSQAVGERTIIFAGFNALTRTEEAIIDKLVKAGKAEVLFDYDKYYLDDETNEAGFFGRRYMKMHEDWMKGGIHESLQSEEKNIHLVAATGNAIQCKALQSKLQALDEALREEKEKQNDNEKKSPAVVLADEKLLIPVLNAIPDTPNYAELKVSMGYPMQQTPVNQFIKAYLTLQRGKKIKREIQREGKKTTIEGWYLWPLLRFMTLELVRIIFTHKESKEFARWKADALDKGVFIFEDSMLQEFDSHPELKEFLGLLTQVNETPEALVNSIRNLLHFVSQKIASLYQSQEMNFLQKQVSESGKIINRLGEIVKQHCTFVTDKESIGILYRLVSNGVSIKLNHSNTDGLQIMGLLETRNLDFEQLHLLSVNEGTLPTDKSQGSFIPNFIKKAYGLPGYYEKQAVFAYHFYHLLQSASEIYLYYNAATDKSGGEPSRFIHQIVEELGERNPNIKVHNEPFEGQEMQTSEVLELSAQKTPFFEALKEKVCESGLSPTAISTYLDCPLRFFMQYIENIEDESVDEETGLNVKGTIIHATFENLFKPYKNQVIDHQLFNNEIRDNAEKELDKAIAKELPGGMSDIGYNYLDKLILAQWLDTYMDYTSRCLAAAPITILSTEEKLSTTLQVGDYTCLIKGFADRIDQYGGLTRVIDYKSGAVKEKDVELPIRKVEQTDFEYLKAIPQKALQLLIYKYLYIKNNPQVKPEQVGVALHSLKHPRKMEYALRKATPTSTEVNNTVPFLTDENFIADMETLLSVLIEDIFNMENPFVQCEESKKSKNPCSSCDFRTICKR